MTERILVPTDFSDRAERAARWARQNFPQAFVQILHVLDTVGLQTSASVGPVAGALPAAALVNLQTDFEAEARESLARLGGGELVTGSPTETILQYVDAGRFDLIVVGATGKSGLEKLLIGSTAERLVRESRVPVVVVR